MPAPHRNRRILWITSWIVAAALFIGVAGSAVVDYWLKHIEAGPRLLMDHPDLPAILRACNQVLSDPVSVGFPPLVDGKTSIHGRSPEQPVPPALPQVLKDLHFDFMAIHNHTVGIYFGNGFHHWGYSTAPSPSQPQRELIPGLWFWNNLGIPRNLSRLPYFLITKILLVAASIALILAITLKPRIQLPAHD